MTSPSDVSTEATESTTKAAATVAQQNTIPANFLEPPSPTNASSEQDGTTKQKSESDVLDLDDFIANVLKRTTEAPESTPSVESSSTISTPIEESTSVGSAAQGKSLEERLLAIIASTTNPSTTEVITSTTTQSSTSSTKTEESYEHYSASSEEGSTSDSYEYSGELIKDKSTTAEASIVSTTAEPTSKATSTSELSSIASSTTTASLDTTEPTIDTTILPEINLESVTEITSEYKNFTISFQQGPTPSAADEEVKGQPRKRSISEKTAIPYVLKAMKQTGSTECIFSGTTYKAGEKIKTDDDCLKCFCEFPPIGQCFQKDNCYQ